MAGLLVLHDIPGRLRLRLPPHVEGTRVEEMVAREPGVAACVWAPLTKSLLIQYRADLTTSTALWEAVAAHTGTVEEPAAARQSGARGGSPLARVIREAAAELNEGVARATGGALDLRILLPLALVAWGLREIVRGQAGPLAWSAALWYAHGLFRDYDMAGDAD